MFRELNIMVSSAAGEPPPPPDFVKIGLHNPANKQTNKQTPMMT